MTQWAWGQAVAEPEIEVQYPGSTMEVVDGGPSVFFGVGLSLTFTIRNTGTADLTGLTVTKSGTYADNYVITESPVAPLPPGGSTTMTVQFTSTAAYPTSHPAVLHIASNDANENPFDMNLTGSRPPPAMRVAGFTSVNSGRPSYDLGTVAPGSTASRTVTIWNDGGGDLTILGLSILSLAPDPLPGEFTYTAPAETTVAPGSSTTFTVRFTPRSGGIRNGGISIQSNSIPTYHSGIYLSGQANAPEIQVVDSKSQDFPDGGSYPFGQVHGKAGTKTFTIKNTGLASLTGLTATVDGAHAGEFKVSPDLSTTTVGAQSSTTFTVTFTAGGPGLRTAALHITSNDADENPYDLNLSGRGSADMVVRQQWRRASGDAWSTIYDGWNVFLDSLLPGTERISSFQIYNAGVEDLTGLAVSLPGVNPDVYELVENLPVTTLAPGETTSFSVKFTAIGAGEFKSALVITSNDPVDNPFDVELSGWGSIPDVRVETDREEEVPDGSTVDFSVGQRKYLLIKNAGAGMLKLHRVFLEGADADAFRVRHSDFPVENMRVEGNGNSALWLDFQFVPRVRGTHTATLRIVSDDKDEADYTVTLRGTLTGSDIQVSQLTPTANLALASGAEVLFPTRTVNTFGQVHLRFLIKNPGELPLRLSPPVFEPALPQHVYIHNSYQQEVPPGGETVLELIFTPKEVGEITTTLTMASNATGRLPFRLVLKGTSVPQTGGFDLAFYAGVHGDTKRMVGIQREVSAGAASVRVTTHELPATALPPFEPAVAGKDYVALNGVTVNFAEGEALKFVELPLIYSASRARVNRHLRLELSDPSANLDITGAASAVVQLLVRENAKPTLTVQTPAAGARLPAQSNLEVTGKVGDALGVRQVSLVLNGVDAGVAELLAENKTGTPNPAAMVFSKTITPALGANVLEVTAYDMRLNRTTVRREFIWVREQVLRLSLNDNQGTITAKVKAPARMVVQDASASNAKTLIVDAGAMVEAVATLKPGYVVSHWSTGTQGLPLNHLGDRATFHMPDSPVQLQAHLVRSPFVAPAGQTNQMFWQIHPDDGSSPVDYACEAQLSATLTASGSLSGRLLVNGLSLPVVATLRVQDPALFTVAGEKLDYLPYPGGALRLERDETNGFLWARITHTKGTSTGMGVRPEYSATKKVPKEMLNHGTWGYYTMYMARRYPSAEPVPPVVYPTGSGFATMRLTNTGGVTLTGVLADGTAVTLSTVLGQLGVPVFIQLPTPGGTTKQGLLTGSLDLSTYSGYNMIAVTGRMQWYRPAAASPKVRLHPHGWPTGMPLLFEGAPYDSRKTVQAGLVLPSWSGPTSDVGLIFDNGRPEDRVEVNNYVIRGNTVQKFPATDRSFSLVLDPAMGLFSGHFTPAWMADQPRLPRPTFRGVIVQQPVMGSFEGFFISPLPDSTVQVSGSVSIPRVRP